MTEETTGGREGDERASHEKGTRPWTPNRSRTVRSKKSLDQTKIKQLTSDEGTVYRGELDPRKKDPDRRPRSISRSEEKVMAKARELAENDPVARSLNKKDAYTDFRDRYERCNASPGRLAALFATQQVRRRGAFAQEVIESTIDRSYLSQQDRAFATLLTLGVVSTYGALDEVINRCLASPRDIKSDVRDAMRISAYEIIYLRKAPHAALDQGVELVRAVAPSAAGLGNAVLHRVLALADKFPFGDPTRDIEALALYYAFPTWLATLLVHDMGAQAASKLMKASNEQAPLFISVNSLRATDEEILALFDEVGARLEPVGAGGVEVPGCYRVSQARVLADGRIAPLFSQGKILVSDAAAQAVSQCVLADGQPESILEVGAGRGTKTILLQNASNRAFGSQLKIASMDSHGFKTELLKERARSYGIRIHDIVTGNATRLDRVMPGRRFSTVFIDAPCSGLGTLRRHHEIRWRISPEQIDELAKTGLALMTSAAGHVEPGGTLVYSTCTVTKAENEGAVGAFLESEQGRDFEMVPLAEDGDYFVTELASGACDAHFAAKFVRKA